MLCFSVATAGAFGSSSVLAPRELAIHGKKIRKKRLCPGASLGGGGGVGVGMGAAGIA